MANNVRKLAAAQSESEKNALLYLAGIINIVIMSVGFLMVLNEILSSFEIKIILLLAIMTISGAVFLLLLSRKAGRYIMPAAVIVIAAVCIALQNIMRLSGGYLINDFADKLCAATGKIFLHTETGYSPMPAMLAISILCSLLFAQAVAKGSILPLFPIILSIFAMNVIGKENTGIGWAIFMLGALSVMGAGALQTTGREIARLLIMMVSACLCLCVCFAMREKLDLDLKNEILGKTHEILYDCDTNTMPEGRINKLGPFRKNKAEALAVIMEKPQKLYLRGIVFDKYTGNTWEKCDTLLLSQYRDNFFLMHENDVFGQALAAKAAETVGNIDVTDISVTNISACREHSYIPIGFASCEALDERSIGDFRINRGIEKFKMQQGTLADWYSLQGKLYDAMNDKAVSKYLKYENMYQGFASAVDLQMTADCYEVIERQLKSETKSNTLAEIQTKIRKYLSENLSYDENAVTDCGNEDFIHCVLEKSGLGYSVHYATAATMIFRYYGVPARYVEGYYLSKEQAEGYENGDVIILTEENAHAWCEYYLNGVGFVPFEVTPGYIDDDDLNAGAGHAETGSTRYVQNQKTYAKTQQPMSDTPEKEKKEKSDFDFRILLLLIPLIALALLIMIVIKRLKFRSAMRKMRQADHKTAITMQYGYASKLKEVSGVTHPLDETAAQLNSEALFSEHPMTAVQRRQMEEYTEEIRKMSIRSWNILKKLRYKVIECVY